MVNTGTQRYSPKFDTPSNSTRNLCVSVVKLSHTKIQKERRTMRDGRGHAPRRRGAEARSMSQSPCASVRAEPMPRWDHGPPGSWPAETTFHRVHFLARHAPPRGKPTGDVHRTYSPKKAVRGESPAESSASRCHVCLRRCDVGGDCLAPADRRFHRHDADADEHQTQDDAQRERQLDRGDASRAMTLPPVSISLIKHGGPSFDESGVMQRESKPGDQKAATASVTRCLKGKCRYW